MRRTWVVPVVVLAFAVVLAGCETPWRAARFSPAQTGFNPGEHTIDRTNVGSLALTATTEVGAVEAEWVQPIVAGGSVFIARRHELVVTSADGSTNCAGVPRTCTPQWTAPIAGDVDSAPAVVDGNVYVVAQQELSVFDAQGHDGCSGVPVTCAPLWTAPVGSHAGPSVVGNRVYVIDERNHVAVLDASGVEGCAGVPKVCTPLWTTEVDPPGAWQFNGWQPPTVAAGTLFLIDYQGNLSAFDAAGVTNCAGVPVVCSPRWTAPGLGGGPMSGWTAPIVVGDQVVTYQAADATHTQVAAYDVHGLAGCAGSPVVCAPRWSTLVDGKAMYLDLTAAYGSIFVLTSSVPGNQERLTVIADDGSGCAGDPMICPVRWEDEPAAGGAPLASGSPVVANDLLYVSTSMGIKVFDATPDVKPGDIYPCTTTTGLNPRCVPIATITTLTINNAVVSDGRVYALGFEKNDVGLVTGTRLQIFG